MEKWIKKLKNHYVVDGKEFEIEDCDLFGLKDMNCFSLNYDDIDNFISFLKDVKEHMIKVNKLEG